ncbi:MAG: MATE family efflux transporter [bacterium]|nr:MATE family efflux transporter [bacterium]
MLGHKSTATLGKEAQRERMLREPVGKLIISLGAPTTVIMAVTTLYLISNVYFVSKLGTSANAAVSVVFVIFAFFNAVGYTFGRGAESKIEINLSSGDDSEASRFASTSFFTAILIGLLTTALGIKYIEGLMRLLGATESILPYAVDYSRFVLLSAPFACSSYVMNNILRAEGKAAYSMRGLLSGSLLNIALTPILMFYFRMGIAGAGVSTLVSQCAGFAILGSYFIRRKSITRLNIANISRNPREYYDIFRIGSPSLTRQGFSSISAAALNYAAGPYGDAAIAAMSVVSRIVMFLFAIVTGITQGFLPVAAYNYGAKQYARIRDGFWFTVKVGSVCMISISAVTFIFAREIVTVFSYGDAAIIGVGTRTLRCQAVFFVLQPLFIITEMMMQELGFAARASILASLRQGLFFLPLLTVLPLFMGLNGIVISQAAANVLTFFATLPFVYAFMKTLDAREEAVPDSAETAVSAKN